MAVGHLLRVMVGFAGKILFAEYDTNFKYLAIANM